MALKDIFHGKEKTESQVPPMKIFDNITEIVRDDLQKTIKKNGRVSVAAACFSMYAYQELKQQLDQVDEFRFIFTSPTFIKEKAEKQKREFYIPRLHRENSLYGTEFEIKLRNELTQRAIAKECASWIKAKAKFKSNTTGEHMGGFMTVASPSEQYAYAPINGFTTVDIGRERGNNSYNMVQGMEAPFATQYMQLFDTLWNDQGKMQDVTDIVIENISNAYNENSPEFIYFMTLYHVFSEFLEDISEDTLPNEATGFKQSQIWNKLYDFQKDAVLAIINKLEKYNGCILADSVGLGKTFTALAVIKYYENRNKSVLVLCPKKLAENWNTYKDNYVNNPIAKDRLNYDVLFHTDLSRNGGQSNGLDLDRLNWGNYDLVVIDESHNFRNGGELSGDDAKENRYLRLLNKVVRAGVKTKVLMLSATPVNNRFNDLKNQLALAYEGDSTLINDKLNTSKSIDEIFRQAQTAFNAWSKLEPEDRTTDALLRTLDFDFFEVLDSVTIDLPFDNPKSKQLLMELIKLSEFTPTDIILDFFSGSATTAHAVMQLNATDNGHRRFIMVQLPEICEDNSDAAKQGYKNICEIGKQRIRLAGAKIKGENPLASQNLDTGFRVLKLADSNMNDVYYGVNEYEQGMLSLLESNIKSDRTDLDLLFGCLLEWGLPLSLPYSSETIEGCTVHNYNDGDLIACFDENVPESVIKAIAKKKPLRAVFRDSSFANSPSKINVGEIFKMLAPDTRVKVI